MMMTSWTSATDSSRSMPYRYPEGVYIFSHHGQAVQRLRGPRRADGRLGRRLAQAPPLGARVGARERDPLRDLREVRPHRALRREARTALLGPAPEVGTQYAPLPAPPDGGARRPRAHAGRAASRPAIQTSLLPTPVGR